MNMKKSISILMAAFAVSLSVPAQTWQPADPAIILLWRVSSWVK
mgnify:CR=1 FL=1